MATIKRNTMIDGLFLDIATKQDIQTVNRLYATGRKGSAVALQLRRITIVWEQLINGKYKEDKELQEQEALGFKRIQFS